MEYKDVYVLLAVTNDGDVQVLEKNTKEYCETVKAGLESRLADISKRIRDVMEKFKPETDLLAVGITDALKYREYTEELARSRREGIEQILSEEDAKYLDYQFVIV